MAVSIYDFESLCQYKTMKNKELNHPCKLTFAGFDPSSIATFILGELSIQNPVKMSAPSDSPPAAVVAMPSPDSSLSLGLVTDTPEQISMPQMDYSYVTWPAPEEYPPPYQSVSDENQVEPFPDFPNPVNSLIIARTLLLDKLHLRVNSPHPNSKPLPCRPFESVLSRIVKTTGHIKEHEDLTRCRAAVPQINQTGEALRSQRAAGNAAKLVRLRDEYPDTYRSKKDPEPKHFLKNKLKEYARWGISQALAFEREVGWDIVKIANVEEILRGRPNKRQARGPPGPSDDDIVRSLLMLRETYPSFYESSVVIAKKGKSTEKKKLTRTGKEYTSHRTSIRGGQASSSMRAVKNKASTMLRRIANKFGLHRSASKLNKRASSASLEAFLSSLSALDMSRLSEPVEIDMAGDETLDQSSTEQANVSIEQEEDKRQSFVIERENDLQLGQNDSREEVFITAPPSPIGSMFSAESTPIIPRRRSSLSQCSSQDSLSDSSSSFSITSSLSTISSNFEIGLSTNVTISRPRSPPRVVSIKKRNRLQKRPNAKKPAGGNGEMRTGKSRGGMNRDFSSGMGLDVTFSFRHNLMRLSLAVMGKIDQMVFARRGH
ncbi:hypothetical protein LTR10_021199 [Elasticomyces elasticus]|uniref:Sld7 C-terminal domain-containing protein n=1 Tax=Exophiala sideris TaxID=1016849 RepID=A0ABR0IY11_9EURO|nr:hypothetical protein LTR10_021199 [Elasticomyces elasticus]KAK5022325.1 hypothetical protein LTS07_010201 [Exophiala sideris]KAK5027137.1 hypothetical protein LTR13_009747 [Exophiala sideris]KAK5051712.1 hypothetical protein LTR69_010212 [Exophiala sideris]KAK5177677.1 hypothetical protein LTR44_009867 [Eurotiomycetes sp. CCFEE 6388]